MVHLISVFLNFILKYFMFFNILFVIIVIFVERKRPLYTLFWILLLITLPYIGFIIYLFFGLSFSKKRLAKKFYNPKLLKSNKLIQYSNNNELSKFEQLINYLEVSSKNNLTSENIVDVLPDSESFFNSLKEELKLAKEKIIMEYYVFRFDDIGREICEILADRSKNGVEVVLIIDGTNTPNKEMTQFLKDNGISLNIFFPSYIPFLHIGNLRANYRDHRKICVIDSKLGFIGGVNIGDEYLGRGELGHWSDLAIKMTGEIVLELEKEFNFSMSLVTKDVIPYVKKDYAYYDLVNKELSKKATNKTYVQVVSAGPNYEYRTLRDNHLNLIMKAKKSIYIQTPYFVPDDTLVDALKIAALSGTKVNIMIPNKPDHPFVYWTNQYYVGELINLGINIYEYELGFLHNKLLIIDDEVVSIGSCNFDYRSFYQNFEMNVNIYDKEIARDFVKVFRDGIKNGSKINKEKFNNRSLYIKLKESICKLLSPVL